MTQQEYIELFNRAQNQCNQMLQLFPNNGTLKSIEKQLSYLLALSNRENIDTSRLKDICIGTLAARELEGLGMDAEVFYQVQSAAKFFRI